MTFPEDVDNSNAPSRFFGRRLILAIIIVLVAGLTFGLWFFLFPIQIMPLRIVISIYLPTVIQ